MPREDDKETTVILRKNNEKSFECHRCQEKFNSKQALWYHLHEGKNLCRDAEDKERDGLPVSPGPVDPPKTELVPFNLDIDQVQIGSPGPVKPGPPPAPTAAAGPRPDENENEPLLDGDTPPIPMVLVYMAMFILILLGVVVLFWGTIWKLYRKYSGGEPDAGRIEPVKQ